MYYSLTIPDENGRNNYFSFNFGEYSMSHRYEVENVCIIDVYKIHDHRYDLKAFFYKKKRICYQENIRSKKELYSAYNFYCSKICTKLYSNARTKLNIDIQSTLPGKNCYTLYSCSSKKWNPNFLRVLEITY